MKKIFALGLIASSLVASTAFADVVGTSMDSNANPNANANAASTAQNPADANSAPTTANNNATQAVDENGNPINPTTTQQ